MSNDATIQSHLADLKARAETLKDLAEDSIVELRLSALSMLGLPAPELDFTVPSLALSTENTEVSADFASGLLYQDAATLLSTITQGGYSSDFLDYLEDQAKGTPLETWAQTLNSLRGGYALSANAKGLQFCAGLVLFPSTYLTGMAAVVTDGLSRHELDYFPRWQTAVNEALIDAGQAMLDAGISIEEVRSRMATELIGLHQDYNRALIDKAQTDFAALRDQATLIRKQIDLNVQRHSLSEGQAFSVSEFEERAGLLALDKSLAESADWIRRNQTEFALRLGKNMALVEYTKSALAGAQLNGGAFTIHSSTSEDTGA